LKTELEVETVCTITTQP